MMFRRVTMEISGGKYMYALNICNVFDFAVTTFFLQNKLPC